MDPDDIVKAIPGFGVSPLTQFVGTRVREADPRAAMLETRERLLSFLRHRDTIGVLARTGIGFLIDATRDPTEQRATLPIEQVEVEVLQALALSQSRGPDIPFSPRSFARAMDLGLRNIKAFAESIAPDVEAISPVDQVVRETRIQTLYYRNIFDSDEAARIVPALLGRMDTVSERRLGYRLSDFSRACFSIFAAIGERIGDVRQRVGALLEGHDVDCHLAEMLASMAYLERPWRFAKERFPDEKERGQAAFQLSELAWAPAFTLHRSDLVMRYGEKVTEALFLCSIAFGELAGFTPDHIYLTNPIHARPFVRIDENLLFLPIPALLISFPFEMIEHLLGADEALRSAYSDARSDYLEDAVDALLREALPSARVYQGVEWTDPETKVEYENDVVAVLGNHIFLFEAKSGKLNPAARRGGVDKLRNNLTKLYVEANEQAVRLETLLGRGEAARGMLRDKNGVVLDIDLSTPNTVCRFGICIEHFASITSRRRAFVDLGLIGEEEPWSPILSLSELRMIAAHLDTEISFFHYLTRRYTLESVLSFRGDEQDLLSMYLTNGFVFDVEALKGQELLFGWADAPVRGRKMARADRRVAETPGIVLSPGWRLVVAEIYASTNRHRFDIIEVILNQAPGVLAEMERRIRRWKTGGGGFGKGNLMFRHAAIGNRVFVVSVLAAKEPFLSQEEWRDASREQAAIVAQMTDATDLVILCRDRRSSRTTFDAISFFRFPPDGPSSGLRAVDIERIMASSIARAPKEATWPSRS